VLSAMAVNAPMTITVYDTFNWYRLSVVLVGLILLHIVMRPRLLFTRELALYTALFLYMSISSIWTPDPVMGLNTLVPALDFVLIMILFGSLVAFHNLRSVLTGMLAGFLLGAAVYTLTIGFPFLIPEDFSYNAVAGMYLFGLLSTLFYAWYRRSRFLPLGLSLIILFHIAATTSIKTNLGIALGTAAGALFYARSFLRVLWRNIILLGILSAALVYAVVSNDVLLERVQSGFDRVSSGFQILQHREDQAGNTSFAERAEWGNQGIKGWLRSPLLGNGAEAFRTDHGITSHSTPIDLLYNFGVIGLVLFYAIFGSIVLRLMSASGKKLGSLPALIFSGVVCYAFITLSATMHYNALMAVFFSVSTGLLRRQRQYAVPKQQVLAGEFA
jgi:O-antigen ligase